MKLLSFDHNGIAHVGVAASEVDLTRALERTHPGIKEGHSLLAIIQSGLDIDTIGEQSLERLRSSGAIGDYLVANPSWLPPILRPPKILALALNYQEHIDESNLSFFNEPIIFAKYGCSMIAHESEIELPPFPQKVDEEHELAMVVGRDCRHILPSQALDHIFGWTIVNDVSARDRQRERLKMGQPYAYAKNFAGFCPTGPWVVTKKEIATPMEAGDVISLGTFAGDTVELEVEGIGVLRNRVVAVRNSWRNFAAGVPTGPLVREASGPGGGTGMEREATGATEKVA